MRGGKRPGAGRPKSQSTKRLIQISIPENLADRLPKRPAALISKLLINHFKSTTMSTILNLTPYNVHVKCEDGWINVFEASGTVARVSSPQRKASTIVVHSKESNFSVFANEFGEVYLESNENGQIRRIAMPKQEDNVYYIVSSFVAQAMPHSTDLICRNSTDAVRNEKGHIMHTNGFMLP